MDGIQKLSLFALIAWGGFLAFCGSLLLSFHFFPQRVDPMFGFSENQGFFVHHFLSMKCKCSKNILKHLIQRASFLEITEKVHLIDGNKQVQESLLKKGFSVEILSEETASRLFNLQATPQLVILKNHKILYQGGYGKDQQHSQIYKDADIIADLLKNKNVLPYPLFGCANGQLRKIQLDSMGLKYLENN